MKTKTNSSIRLLREDSKLVATLQTKLKVKSKIEVVRRGRRGHPWARSWQNSIT